MINKVLAGTITLGFMTVVQPDPEATVTGMIFAALLLFVGLDYCIGYIRKINQKHYTTVRRDKVSKEDIQRWADEWITWPMREAK